MRTDRPADVKDYDGPAEAGVWRENLKRRKSQAARAATSGAHLPKTTPPPIS